MGDDEAPRPTPDFRVHVHRGTNIIDVTDAVMDVYDTAINSMDFGSGFLSTEEVGNLRALGVAIGAQHFDYQHDKCLRCGHDFERHYTAAVMERAKLDKSCRVAGGGCTCAGYIRPGIVINEERSTGLCQTNELPS